MTYESFEKCYNENLEKLWFDMTYPDNYDSRPIKKYHKLFFEDNEVTGYELMKTLEEEMSDKNCASICDYVPLFYVKKAVTDGSP